MYRLVMRFVDFLYIKISISNRVVFVSFVLCMPLCLSREGILSQCKIERNLAKLAGKT